MNETGSALCDGHQIDCIRKSDIDAEKHASYREEEEKGFQEENRMGQETHAQKAEALFLSGYNCSQAVFCAFCDVTEMEIDQAARLASSFGAGMGRMREVCGTVSAALLVMGIVEGYSDPHDPSAKKKHYEWVREFARRFREKEGSIICRELLSKGGVEKEQILPGGDPQERTADYYRKRPCPKLCALSAQILDEMLSDRS